MGGYSVAPNSWEVEGKYWSLEGDALGGGYEGLGGGVEMMGGGREAMGGGGGRDERRKLILCHCGVQAPLVIARHGENRGRKFWGCGLFQVHRRKVCEFFKWNDYEEVSREKEVIVRLKMKIEDMKKKERILVSSLGFSLILIMVLVIAYVTK